jgi:hypothetical protein
MTRQEFEYIRRANLVLADPTTTTMAAAKICRVISQIYKKAADELEFDLVDKVDNLLYNTQTKQRSEHA